MPYTAAFTWKIHIVFLKLNIGHDSIININGLHIDNIVLYLQQFESGPLFVAAVFFALTSDLNFLINYLIISH